MNPLVTFILLAYNQEKFIESAINGLLEQDYDNIEFIISDDCSPDDTYEKICAITKKYLPRKNIILNRNEENLGLVRHFNKLINMSNGDIIVLAAGDDISLKSRVSNTVNIFSKNPDVMFLSFNDNIIDAEGKLVSSGSRVDYDGVRKFDLDDFISGKKIPFSGASRAFRREVYDTFGDLNPSSITEDTPYIIRGLILGQTAISSDVEIYYRKHDNNLSRASSLAKMDIDCISQQYIIDCNIARDRDLISKNRQKKLSKWIEVNRDRRKILNGLTLSKSKINYFFRKIAPLSSISSRRKISILKKIILDKV
ncbi:glycosyltransferase [Psychrobacter sp. DM8]|uniref:glycosyltransferase n=1 Tax=Psychrobacter sp. DM8 TaxID=3440636 RepID=UPI003F504F09